MAGTQSNIFETKNFPKIIQKSDKGQYVQFNGHNLLEYIIKKETPLFTDCIYDSMQSFFWEVRGILFCAETNPEIIKQRQELFGFALADSQFTSALSDCYISNTDSSKRNEWTNKNRKTSTRYNDFKKSVRTLTNALGNKKLPHCLDMLLASLKECSNDLTEAERLIEQPFRLEINFCGQYKKFKYTKRKDETKNKLDVILSGYSYEVTNTANNTKHSEDYKNPTNNHEYVREIDGIGFNYTANSINNYLGHVLHSLLYDVIWLEEEYKVIKDKGSFSGQITYISNTCLEGSVSFESGKENIHVKVSDNLGSPDLRKPDILFLNRQYVREKDINSKDSFRMIESHNYRNLFHKFILDYWNDNRYEIMKQFENTIDNFDNLLWELRVILPLTNMMKKIQKNFQVINPEIVLSDDTTTNTDIYIKNMQNPILAYFSSAPHKDFKVPEQLIPNNVDITTDKNVIIITGPNGNGKTTFLESILANYCLFQAGLSVVADEAKIRIKTGARALYGESGNILEGESTHMADCRNYSEFLDHIKSHMIITSDESFSATAIEDATNIQRNIIENFIINANVTFLMVVHNTLLAEEMSKNPYVTTLCCKLDHSENPPKKMYKVVPGIDKSYGYLEAEKYGLDIKSLQTRFEKRVGEGAIVSR